MSKDNLPANTIASSYDASKMEAYNKRFDAFVESLTPQQRESLSLGNGLEGIMRAAAALGPQKFIEFLSLASADKGMEDLHVDMSSLKPIPTDIPMGPGGKRGL